MMKRLFDLLKTLSETPGPVGREGLVQEKVKEHLVNFGLEVLQDKIGNLTATMLGTNKHYALVAHADEVGFLVSHIDSSGFIRVKWNTAGHMPDLRLLPGQRVVLMTNDGMVPGVFCVKTAHIAGPEGKKKLPSYGEIFLDIGATSAEEVEERGVHIGTPVLYDTLLRQNGHNVVGKSMDDRVGLTMLVVLAEEFSKLAENERPTLTFVSTVMEELGAKGAAAVARNLDVDGVIILEIGLADDHPGTEGEAGVALGKGPVIVVKDTQLHYSHDMIERLVTTAEKSRIPVQRAVYHNYATDGLQMVMQGQLVSTLAIPCRYSHSSFESLNLADVENAIQLLMQFLKE
ncbi:MAG: M42 family metallopeptidase [Candidatus Thorarchaeota archaeon]|jgi:endoglucanase